jgi:hypothetical protein
MRKIIIIALLVFPLISSAQSITEGPEEDHLGCSVVCVYKGGPFFINLSGDKDEVESQAIDAIRKCESLGGRASRRPLGLTVHCENAEPFRSTRYARGSSFDQCEERLYKKRCWIGSYDLYSLEFHRIED